MRNSCGTCDFFNLLVDYKGKTDPEFNGDCRESGPKAGPRNGRWPGVNANEWCGKWKRLTPMRPLETKDEPQPEPSVGFSRG